LRAVSTYIVKWEPGGLVILTLREGAAGLVHVTYEETKMRVSES